MRSGPVLTALFLLLTVPAAADTIVLTLDAGTFPPDLQCNEAWTESGLELTVLPTDPGRCGNSLCSINLAFSTDRLVLVPGRLQVDLTTVPGTVQTVEAVVGTLIPGFEQLNLYDGDVLVDSQVADFTLPPDTVRVSSGGAPVDRVVWEPCIETSVYEILVHFDPLATSAIAGEPDADRRDAILPPAPHPFRAGGTLGFRLQRRAWATVTIHDVSGRLMRTLAAGDFPSGVHRVTFDGRNEAGAALPAGVYFERLVVNGKGTGTARIVLLR